MAIGDDLNSGLVSLVRQGMLDNAPKNLGGIYGTGLTEAERAANIQDISKAGDTPLYGIPEFDRLQYAARDYRSMPSLYEMYLSGGFPKETIAADTSTAQIPGGIDTLVNVGDEGGGGGNLLDQLEADAGIDATSPAMDQAAAITTMPPMLDQTGQMGMGKFDDLAPIDAGGITVEDLITGQQAETIPRAPVISQKLQDEGPTIGTISDDRMNEIIGGQPMAAGPFDYLQEQTPISEVQVLGGVSDEEKEKMAKYTMSTQEQTLGNKINSVFENFKGRGTEAIGELRDNLVALGGKVKEGFENIVDFGETQIDVGKTLATGALNYLGKNVFGPIGSVLGTALEALPPGGPTFQTSKAIEVGLAAPGQTQDKYGINTQSMMGNYDKYNVDRVAELEGIVASQIARGLTGTIQMQELKDRKGYNKISGVGGDVEGDQEGMTIAEELGLDIDPGLRVEQKEDIVDAPVDIVDVEAVEEMIENAKIEAEAAKGTVRPGDVDFSQERTDENISQAVDDLAAQYDAQVKSGQRQEDANVQSDVNKAKEMIGMPQQLGDVGGSMDKGPGKAPDRPGGAPATGPHGNGGGTGGSKKIVCTMMNESYGFGSFRNKIWLRQSKNLAPEYQKGYHKIFLPLVKLSKKNIVLKRILEHIAIHRTIDIRQEARGKRHLLGRIYRRILEPICYWVGKNE